MKPLKVKLKYNDKKIDGKLYFKDESLIFIDENNKIIKKIPAYRIVQTGYKRNFFKFDFRFYLKTNDGLPTVFYCCYPKKLMTLVDKYIEKTNKKINSGRKLKPKPRTKS